MSPSLTIEELTAWNDETARKWIEFLTANPMVLEVPSGIYGTKTVLELLHHIFAVEYRYGQRLHKLPVTHMEEIPHNSLAELAEVHASAIEYYRTALADPGFDWAEKLEFQTLTAGTQYASMRKMIAHSLLHGIRHWAQLATLTRAAGYPSGFAGDLLLSPSIV